MCPSHDHSKESLTGLVLQALFRSLSRWGGGVQRGQRSDKHPKKPGLVPQFMWGIGKALGGPRKLGGRGGLLCEYLLSWGE